ncbi:MAG: type II secretory pathway pseudopilin PulG [Phycisphaerales bacterium]|jgi:type II secretory pathway pseudopilin PulG
MVVWVLAVLLAVAVPTIGSSRDSARVRFAAGTVAQEIRLAGQLAFAHGRAYSLDAATKADTLIRTPLGLSPEDVVNLAGSEFHSVLIPSAVFPYSNTLELDSGGDAATSVSWTVVSGSIAASVTQPEGPVDPTISSLTKPSAIEISKFKLRVLSLP